MMTSSKLRQGIRNVPAPEGQRPSPYARFIPGEEVNSFTAWQPGSLNGNEPQTERRGAARPQPEAPKVDAEFVAQQLRTARQAGYQDGYRDGLVALEGFKQSFATQMTAQLGLLTAAYGEQLDSLQQDMARALAVAATRLARQIVRSELQSQPETIAQVAAQSLDALLLSAQHITVRVHPDDHPLVAQGAADALAARGARLVNDAQIQRGGCLIESDIGVVDASIEARWLRAIASVGCETPWEADEADINATGDDA